MLGVLWAIARAFLWLVSLDLEVAGFSRVILDEEGIEGLVWQAHLAKAYDEQLLGRYHVDAPLYSR